LIWQFISTPPYN